MPGFPATPEEHAGFLTGITEELQAESARGLCYWSPDYVAAPEIGSPWENLALFDNTGRVLPAAAVLGGQR